MPMSGEHLSIDQGSSLNARASGRAIEDRLMYGTDHAQWPGMMAYSISLIQSADYLTRDQKRDILYNNAARFCRLAPAASN